MSFTAENGYSAAIDGDILKLETLLPMADFENEKLIRDELLLDSGRTLRLISMSQSTWGDETTYALSAWLLTPEEMPAAQDPE